MRRITIIGGGFSGTMLAENLISKTNLPIEVVVVDKKDLVAKGIAYSPYSKNHLLNVVAGKMSAYHEKPDHFIDWVMKRDEYKNKDRSKIAVAFLPRYLYGEYISDIWSNTRMKNVYGASVQVVNDWVADLDVTSNHVSIVTKSGKKIISDFCVIAAGNQTPGNPSINNKSFFRSSNYFQDPWNGSSVKNLPDSPVLILGAGLTMVDTVIGLLENGFENKIYSLSPNGFNILQHKKYAEPYVELVKELQDGMSLYTLVALINKHIKSEKNRGFSHERVIDSIRPYTGRLWKQLSEKDKASFMSKLRHIWGVARHRVPPDIYDRLVELMKQGRLSIISGKIIDMNVVNDEVLVEYFDKRKKQHQTLTVSRVINCTGPQTDLNKLDEESFLKKSYLKGILFQDELKLGIRTNTENYKVMQQDGGLHNNLFTLGTNLKGELWESTAVNELRKQASDLACELIALCNKQ